MSISLWQYPEPAPQPTAFGGLVPLGSLTHIVGSGATHPYLALVLATHLVLGKPLAGLPAEAMPVLFCAPLDMMEVLRRAYRVARGCGVSAPPEGLSFHSLAGRLEEPQPQKALQDAMRAVNGVVIIEGTSARALPTALSALLRTGSTIILLDAGTADGAEAGKATFAPSVIEVTAAEQGAVLRVRQQSNGTGPVVAPFALGVQYTDGTIYFAPLKGEDGNDAVLPRVRRA